MSEILRSYSEREKKTESGRKAMEMAVRGRRNVGRPKEQVDAVKAKYEGPQIE